eukprot:COSAG02_NODE_8788_length_2444_cov_2.973561_2_plen_405_part_00
MSCDGWTCHKIGRQHTLLRKESEDEHASPGDRDDASQRDDASHRDDCGPSTKRRRRSSSRAVTVTDTQTDTQEDSLTPGWVWTEDTKPLPLLHPANTRCRVVCGEKNDEYTVNLLWHAYRAASRRAGLELRETSVFRAKVKDAVKNYRERYADLMALRVVRGELSLHRVRLFVSDQRQQELNHLLSYRIQPVESDVYTRVKNLWAATKEMGVQSITGINGEAGLWKLSSVLNTVLCNEMLSSALSCPVREGCFAVQFDKRYFHKKIRQAPTKHEQLMNVLSFLNINAPGSDNRNKIRLPSADHDTVTVILYNTDRAVVERHVHTLNCLHEMETGYGNGHVMHVCDVHDMTIRCMIDAGARIGRSLTGKTGQTLEIASFKHMRGLWESVVCNAFPTLALLRRTSE